MNRFIARFYSNIIEGLHILFILAVVFIALHLGGTELNYPPLAIGFIVLLVIVGWVVVFGFITTVVVMGNTLNEIREQNEIMAVFLKKIAASTGGAPQVESTLTRSGEPFIRSDDTRR